MKYHIDFQYLAKNAQRPTDDGEIVGIEASDETGVVLLPDVGDYVGIDNSTDGGERSNFEGKVRSRLFRYVRAGKDVHCMINIVVEETDDDWGLLVKE